MKFTLRHILALCLLILCVCSCSRQGRIIPRNKMKQIYKEILLSDQWLRENSKYKAKADTTLFFDPIFEKYGYDFEDFDASIKHYLRKPDEFSTLFIEISDELTKEAEEMNKDLEEERRINALLDSFEPYKPHNFKTDSTRWSLETILWSRTKGAVDTLSQDTTVVKEEKLSLQIDENVLLKMGSVKLPVEPKERELIIER